jgi:glycosyltransferase involved in cell wall biosynthesis
MALKVCQLCAVDFTLDKFLLPLVDGMVAQGWEVISVCSDGPAIPRLRQAGYAIQTVDVPRSLNPLRLIASFWRLYRLFRRERFDLLHTHTPVAALIGRIAAHLAGVPMVVYTAHGFYFHDAMPAWKRRLFVEMERLGGWFTDLLFTQSSEDAQTAVDEKLMPAERVMAIGNGVDPIRFDKTSRRTREDVRVELGLPLDAPVIGMVGRLVAEKGVREFLAAAGILASEFPHVHFLLVGERLASDHADPVDDAVTHAKGKLGARLILAGMRKDIPDLMGAMDVFCLPSYREGMPRTIIEAMMSGLPVVATDIRGSREEVVANDTGLLVPARDAAALAKAFARLIKAHAEARAMGEAGRRRALRLYDEHKVVGLQIDTIQQFARLYRLL